MLDDKVHVQGQVLVVEDDGGLRDLIVRRLTKSGYPAAGVASGAAALEQIATDPPAALLIDQKLPDMTGQQIIATLAGWGVAMPFIVMTGQGDERLAVEMMKLGASDYLVKDVEFLDILPMAVERLFKALEMERELQETRSNLMKSEELYRKLLTTVPDVIVQTDVNGHITFVNEYTLPNLKDIPRKSLLGRNMLAFIVEKDRPRAIKNTQLMFDHPLGPQEYQLQWVDGTVLDAEVNGDVIYDAENNPTGMVYVIRDITERKRAEEALKTSQAYTRNLIDSSLDMIIAVDLERRIVEFNRAAQETFGYRLEQVLGQPIDMLYADPQEGLWVHRTTVLQGHCVREITNRRQNGELFPCQLSASCLRDARGELVGVMGVSRDITERKRAEQELLVTRDLLEQTGRMARVGGWEKNLLNGDDRWSAVTREIHEVSDDFTPSMQRGIDFYKPGASRDTIIQMVTRAIEHGEPFDVELQIITARGNERWVRAIGRPEFREGQCIRLYGTFQDIDDRKRAEERLALLAQMVDIAPGGIIVHDFEGRILYANQRAAEMHGWSAQEFMALTLREVNAPESAALIPPRMNEVAEQGEASFEVWHRRKDGSAYPEQVYTKKIAWAGEPAILSIATDITERKQAEERLREREERLRETAQIAKVGGWEIDLLGNTLSWTEETFRIHELPTERLPNVNEAIQFYHPDDQPKVTAAVQQAIEGGGFDFEARLITPRKNQLWVRAIGNTIWREGRPVGVRGMIQDITERKALETQLRRQEQLAAIGQLAAGIAHDFRNLLTTIILYAQLGQRKPDVPPTVAQYLAIIAGEAHKATTLVQQILDFSRRTVIERRLLDLAAFAGHVVAILQRTLPENIHITLETGPGTHVIEGDAGRLQQALMNLALNARDAMPTGGALRIGLRRIAVTPGSTLPLPAMLEALAPPAWICLSVADTGPGLTDAAYAHLFEPFFTTKEEGQGTGLGLAQVYGIIQLHHGYIDVENAPGHGVTFRLYLPAAAEVTEDSAATPAPLPTGQGETLLLVEDNAHLRAAEQQLLIDLGYRVLTAANGREALALYQQERAIALLITDLVMPEMGGQALLETLRRDAPHLKALVMTGYTAEESEAELRAAGFLEVIRKPLDADRLAHAIHRALETAAGR